MNVFDRGDMLGESVRCCCLMPRQISSLVQLQSLINAKTTLSVLEKGAVRRLRVGCAEAARRLHRGVRCVVWISSSLSHHLLGGESGTRTAVRYCQPMSGRGNVVMVRTFETNNLVKR